MAWIDRVVDTIDKLSDEMAAQNSIVLTESDLKVHLCTGLRRAPEHEQGAWTVNTESPWYDDETGRGPLYIDVTVFDRELLHVGYLAHLRRKGYRYDGPSAAIELKYCRYESDAYGIVDDIKKLRNLARKPTNTCLAVALARTPQIFRKAAEVVDAVDRPSPFGANPIHVYLLAGYPESAEPRKKTWQIPA